MNVPTSKRSKDQWGSSAVEDAEAGEEEEEEEEDEEGVALLARIVLSSPAAVLVCVD